MAKHTFTVVYELDELQNETEFTIDIGDLVEEDFQGGEGEEILEQMLLDLVPEATLMWIECPENMPE